MTLSGVLEPTVGTDRVAFAFAVTNRGEDTIRLTFPTGMGADLAVYADDGAPADDAAPIEDPRWRWSDGRLFTQAIRHETLAPAETWNTAFEWADPGSGTYTAVATLEAREHECEAHATVSA